MQRSGLKGVRGRPGFTMVELLTVIAIIAILAGILFPVFATVRRNVHKATCTTNLHSIAQGLKMYKDDHGAYPEALYEILDNGNKVSFLYPQYVKTREVFRCPLAPHQINSNVAPPRPLFPVPNDGFRKDRDRVYPVWDSYDGQFEPPNSQNYVVKYVRHWSGPRTGFGDNPRQLLYRNPPEDTVVTWCTYHRDWDRSGANPAPQTGSLDLVLFVGGNVKPIPANRMHPILPVDPQQGRSYLVGVGAGS
jgi:prepilin-type N-terminal cleavage/methylation domain-containing protein